MEGQLRVVEGHALQTTSEKELVPIKLVTATPFRVAEVNYTANVPTSRTSAKGPAE